MKAKSRVDVKKPVMKKVVKSAEKQGLHPRNRFRERYDFKSLIAASPELAAFVSLNSYGDESVDFANPAAVRVFNRALLIQGYDINGWDIPDQYLCPPIPGRADYLHYLADLLAESNGGDIPCGEKVRVLDIGTGANGIYPLIGNREYGWQFVASDIDPDALSNVQAILNANRGMNEAIELRFQRSRRAIFKGVIAPDEVFDLTMCNPPFHASLAEASAGTQRKWKNLGKHESRGPLLNFGGQGAELWCEGGEQAFVCRMVEESVLFRDRCLWFTTLVSKSATLPFVYRALKRAGAVSSKTIEMAQGQKKSRIVAWSFMDESHQRMES